MRVLILGGKGMLGHKVYQTFQNDFDTYVTFHSKQDIQWVSSTGIFNIEKIRFGINARDFTAIEHVVSEINPHIIINCIGIIKQLKESKDPTLSIYTNALFPHLLSGLAEAKNIRLIHISTDCVFSGNKGNYTEENTSDASDLYGRTKYLGETTSDHALTLRTSIIGHELFTNISLVDWFLSQEGKSVNGFVNAIYSGFPTITLCNELKRIITHFPGLHGLYQISADPINKLELLNIIRMQYGKNITITPYTDFSCDRSLDSTKYRSVTGFTPLSWEDMILEMYTDYLNTPFYRKIKNEITG